MKREFFSQLNVKAPLVPGKLELSSDTMAHGARHNLQVNLGDDDVTSECKCSLSTLTNYLGSECYSDDEQELVSFRQ